MIERKRRFFGQCCAIALACFFSLQWDALECLGNEKTTGAQWLDGKQLVVIEIPNPIGFHKRLQRTDFCQNPRWSEFWQIVSHPEFGFTDQRFADGFWQWQEASIQSIEPGNIVFSVKSLAPLTWQMIIRSEAVDPERAVLEIAETWVDLNCLPPDESPGNDPKDDRDSPSQSLQVKEFATVQGHVIWQAGNVYFAAMEDWITASNQPAEVETTIRRMVDEDASFRPLNQNRRYLNVKGAINRSRSGSSTGADIHVDPQFAYFLAGWLDEKEQRAWGANEILSLGLSISLIPSRDRDGRIETVIDGFVIPSEPRTGVAAAVKLADRPAKMPQIDGDICAFFQINMDWGYWASEKERLFNLANGEDSYASYLASRSGMSRQIGDRSFQKIRRTISGTAQGQCYFKKPGGKEIRFIAFRNLRSADDVETEIGVIEETTRRMSRRSSNVGYERGEMEGVPAMISRFSARGQRFVMAFLDEWIVQSDEETMASVCRQGLGRVYPEQVEAMIQRLLAHSTIKDKRSIVVALFPDGWRELQHTLLSKTQTQRIYQSLRQSGNQDIASITTEIRRIRGHWDSYEFPEPQSRAECSQYAWLTLARIASESFGQFILLGNDDERYFRFSMMFAPTE